MDLCVRLPNYAPGGGEEKDRTKSSRRRVAPEQSAHRCPVRGTNPGFYGYRAHSTVLGRGRNEQRTFRPGFAKEGYNPKGRDLFDHIPPQELSETIKQLLGD